MLLHASWSSGFRLIFHSIGGVSTTCLALYAIYEFNYKSGNLMFLQYLRDALKLAVSKQKRNWYCHHVYEQPHDSKKRFFSLQRLTRLDQFTRLFLNPLLIHTFCGLIKKFFYSNCLISRALISSFLSAIRIQTDKILIYASSRIHLSVVKLSTF